MITKNRHNLNVISDIIALNGLDIYMVEPGILVSEYNEAIVLDIHLAKQANVAIARLTQQTAVPHLFLACPGLVVTKEVREWGATDLALKYTLATGIVCNQLSHKIIGNFLIKVQRPPKPTKMFSSVKAAHDWVKTFLQ